MFVVHQGPPRLRLHP